MFHPRPTRGSAPPGLARSPRCEPPRAEASPFRPHLFGYPDTARLARGVPLQEISVMLDQLRAQIPDYAKDLRLNLESVLSETGAPGLTPQQLGMVAVA